MPSANEALQDAILRHQIGLERLSAGEVRRLLVILEATERRIRRLLRERLAVIRLLAPTAEQGISIGPDETARLARLYAEIRGLMAEAQRRLYGEVRDSLLKLGAYEVDFIAAAIGRSTPAPISLAVARPSPEFLRAIVVSKPFAGKLLRDHFRRLSAQSGVFARTLEAQVKEALLTGEPIESLTRRLWREGGAFYRYRHNLRAVVDTAVKHVAQGARHELARMNDDFIEAIQWLATLDDATCPYCMPRDGALYTVEGEPIGHSMPWDGGPGAIHYGCRCGMTYVLPSWEDLGIDAKELTGIQRASMDGGVPAKVKFEEWASKQPLHVLQQLLGKRRGEALFRGELTLREMLDPLRGRFLTLEELGLLEAA